MAIIRLTDIVKTMKEKWTYGDKFFGYTEEFNDNHNTQYPSLLITPPDSVYPKVTPVNGWEEYAFEVYFSDIYNRTQQQNESIEQRWDNLQDLANEWLDLFLKNYIRGTVQPSVGTVIASLTDGSLVIERKKEVANDQLLQLKMNFNWRIFSKCFTPNSIYPMQVEGLKSWLRADSNVTFSIPTKKVSVVGDASGNDNNITQKISKKQPLRYTYGGALDKTRFTFDVSYLESDNNFTPGGVNNNFTIFEVSKIDDTDGSIFGYFDSSRDTYIKMGTNGDGEYEVSISDGTTTLKQSTGSTDTGKFHIACFRKSAKTIYFDYYDADTQVNSNTTDAAFVQTTVFDSEGFTVGCTTESDGLLPPSVINAEYISGDWQEMIIYDNKLSDNEVEDIVGYLNKKYKIY